MGNFENDLFSPTLLLFLDLQCILDFIIHATHYGHPGNSSLIDSLFLSSPSTPHSCHCTSS